MEPPRFRTSIGRCYKQKVFQVDGYLLTFDFVEYGTGNPDGTIHDMYLYVTYVLHQTDEQGKPTGSRSFGGDGARVVDTLAQGEQLFEAADEAGAAAFLADYLKSQVYSQTKEIVGWVWQWLSRLSVH